MAVALFPILTKEVLSLTGIGVKEQSITFKHVTMESGNYICVTETVPSNSLLIINMNNPSRPLRRPTAAHASALMNPANRILAIRACIEGTICDHLQIFNTEAEQKIKSYHMPEQVHFWKWITPRTLGLVTSTSVYHWSIDGIAEPVKQFERSANLKGNQILNYCCDKSEKYLALTGIVSDGPERPHVIKGNMQLFSVDRQVTQAIEAHAAAFATFRVPGNDVDSTLLLFANRSSKSYLQIGQLGLAGKGSYTNKRAELYFPPGSVDDFPVALQVSAKYGIVYVITKLGLVLVKDLDTGLAILNCRISPDPVFLAADAGALGGIYTVNQKGRVLLTTIDEQRLVPFVTKQLKNPELAAKLAKRANLLGAESPAKPPTGERLVGGPFNLRQTGDQAPQQQFKQSAVKRKRSSDDHHSRDAFQRYAFEEISQATNSFAPANLLGEGGFGKVYKGVLDHTEVAIKVMTEEGLQGKEQFQQEVEVHCKIRHPNVAMLLGTCTSPRFCLVYDLMPNGNLEDRLLRQGGSQALTWQTRVRVAAEVAVALLYLHSARPAPIIHRDIKPANILLDQNLGSKLGDVGLAAIAPQLAPGSNLNAAATHVSSPGGFGIGTFAYIDPEYLNEGHFSPASDVYSFGVVLLQLLTGRPPLGLRRAVSMAVTSKELETVLDKSAGVWPAAGAAALARLALKCTETGRAARPNLRSEIVPELVGLRAQAVGAEVKAAARPAATDSVPHKFICPISQDIMDEPVLAADGNHYDRSFIATWLLNHNTSPLTNLKFEHDKLVLDRSLLNEIREWREQHQDD